MTSYRMLMYFLSTLNDSLRIGLGLRNINNYYSRVNCLSSNNLNQQKFKQKIQNNGSNQNGKKNEHAKTQSWVNKMNSSNLNVNNLFYI